MTNGGTRENDTGRNPASPATITVGAEQSHAQEQRETWRLRREGREDIFARTPSRKFTKEAADDLRRPHRVRGPGCYNDVISGQHWGAPHKLPSPSQNTLSWLWRQCLICPSPACCPPLGSFRSQTTGRPNVPAGQGEPELTLHGVMHFWLP